MAWAARTNVRHIRLSIAAVAGFTAPEPDAVTASPTPVGPRARGLTRFDRSASPSTGTGPRSPILGFLLDEGRYTTIELPDARVRTSPAGVNDRGQIVGIYDDARGHHGFVRYKRGRFASFDVPAPR